MSISQAGERAYQNIPECRKFKITKVRWKEQNEAKEVGKDQVMKDTLPQSLNLKGNWEPI